MAEPGARASSRIFISYRREDTAYPAGWLFDRLVDDFGAEQVFKDVDSIDLGDDFVEVITAAVASTDVLLALIGDKWLTLTDEHGRRRLDDPNDFVRIEIEAALARGVRVIPILVEGARMPRSDELPPSLAALARRQALELSPSRFSSDTRRLLGMLENILPGARTEEAAAQRPGPDPADEEAAPVAGAAPAATRESAPRRRLASVRRRPFIAAAAAIVAVGAIALGAVLADETTTSPSREQGRDATLAVFEAWQGNELATLDESVISASARRALTQMPVEPIAPNPAGPEDCYGSPDELDCAYFYPGKDIHLLFKALKYPSGFRVADVRCVYGATGQEPKGGIATCADMVRSF